MNKFKSYIFGALALIALGCGFTSCQDSFDAPDLSKDGPVATLTPNTTIAELKEWMWKNDLNYCDTVYTRDYFTGVTTDQWKGEHVIISGRVLSSDYAGNCFKYIILQDETGALSFSINSYNLYLEYRRGQEVVVDLTGLFAGKYRGLFQIGFPSEYNNGYETSFLAPELFVAHRELNGWPQIQDVDTIEISSFTELGTAPSELRKWQSQLIRINNVTFSQSSDAAAEGITTLSTYHSSGISQTITDSQGATGTVRTSGYANFWNMELPEGPVDVVLIASYYGSNESNASWQYTLIDGESIITDPTVPSGSKDNPYTIGEAIELQSNPDKTYSGWVSGYLVGTVAPEVTEIQSSDDIEWSASPVLANTMVIGPTPDCADVVQCLVIELPQGSALAAQAIRENPDNYKKEFAIYGTFQTVLGTFGEVTDGKTEHFMIEGKGGEAPVGDGSESNPYTCAQVIKMAPSSTTDAVESGVWMSGYIVGYYNEYAGHFETTGAVKTNILMSDNPAASDVSQCVSVQLPIGSVRDALNIADTPSLLGQVVAVYGDVMKYNTLPGIKNTSKYALGDFNPGGGDTPGAGEGSGSGTQASPYNCASIITMNPQSTTDAVATNIWAEGYIVGYYENYGPHFEVSTSQRANILLSDNANASEASQCICIQLVANTDARNALNLVDNPSNLGKKAKVYGDVMKYNTLPGIKNTSAYELDGNSGGNTGGGGNTETPDGVITVAQALNYISSGNIPSGKVKVKGYISAIQEISQSFGNATFTIMDNLSDANGLIIYRSYWLNGDKYTSEDQLSVGAEVIVEGTLVNYNGTTPEMTTGGVMISYNGQTGSGNSGGGNSGGENPGTTPDPGEGTPGTAVFDFTNPTSLSPAQPATGSKTESGNTYEAVSNVTFTNNGVGVTATKGTSTDARIYYQSSGKIQYRIYNGATLSVTSSLPITSIDFEFNNTGTLSGSDGKSYSSSNSQVLPNGAKTMTFTCSANVQINKITVVTAE